MIFLDANTMWVYLYICEPVLGLASPSNVIPAFMELVSLATFVSHKHTYGNTYPNCESECVCESHMFQPGTQITTRVTKLLSCSNN